MKKFLSSHANVTPNKYARVIIITCLTIILNLPIIIVNITMGNESGYNHAYISWAHVHGGAGGLLGGAGLDRVLQLTVDDWGRNMWRVLSV